MSIGTQIAMRYDAEAPRRFRCQSLLFLPREYDRRPKTQWPLLLFLHGAGERGANLAQVAAHGPPRVVQDPPGFPFIVVSPQCPRGARWSGELLLALLDHVLGQFRVDERRVYLTGLSMGGYGSWSLALEHPERFAAVAPVCGGGDIAPILLASGAHLRALRSLGIWAFHGAKDPVVPVTESERMIAALRGIGNKARLTVYPEAAHDSWTETYANPDLYEWLLAHRRSWHVPPARRR